MKRENERFDPTQPVESGSPIDEASGSPIDDAALAGNAADARLIGLIDQATRPPADLKLDWARFRASLAKEQEWSETTQAQPLRVVKQTGKVLPNQSWRIFRLPAWATLAAAAILLLTATTALLLNHFRPGMVGPEPGQVATNGSGGQSTPNDGQTRPQLTPTGPGTDIASAPSAGKAGPMVAFGLSPDAARQLIDRPPANDRGAMLVVFPRQVGQPGQPDGAIATSRPPTSPANSDNGAGAGSPDNTLVLTDNAPLNDGEAAGQPGQSTNQENDLVFMSF